jgi:hypothetical protein
MSQRSMRSSKKSHFFYMTFLPCTYKKYMELPDARRSQRACATDGAYEI